MRRVVVLGASNITLCFPLLAESLRATLGPMELFAAHGHGRSYGMTSRVLVRTLPGIRQCGLWNALEERPSRDERPLALMTDVGNDLVYGAIPDQVLRWVETCVERLREHGCRIVIVTLPLDSILRLGRVRYSVTKGIFFPGKGPTWRLMPGLARSLDAGLREIGQREGIATVRPPGEWYGFDPIHIRRASRPEALLEFLSAWAPDEITPVIRRPTRFDALRYRRLRPAERTILGRTQRTAQPALTLADGSRISLY